MKPIPKTHNYPSQEEARRQSTYAYHVLCDAFGTENVTYDMNGKDKRVTITRPDQMEGTVIAYYTWE